MMVDSYESTNYIDGFTNQRRCGVRCGVRKVGSTNRLVDSYIRVDKTVLRVDSGNVGWYDSTVANETVESYNCDL